MIRESRPRRRLLLLVLLLVVAIGLAACGSGDDGEDGADGDARGGDEARPDEEALAGPGPRPPVTAPSGDPIDGGRLVYGVPFETDGWNPVQSRWAPSGSLIAATFYEPLTAFDVEGRAQPYLAESLVPSDDFRQWTITLRDGISFHDGTALTAEAVADVLNAHRDSGITGPAVRPLEEASVVDDRTVLVEMNIPWVAFPTVLVGQAGMVPAPSVLDSDEGSRNPVGTGSFTFDEWIPDDHLTVAKNDDYWQAGEPHLDEVEFRPIPDATSRDAALRAGDIDVQLTVSGRSILEFREEAAAGNYQLIEDEGENEETFIILNTARPPLDDLRVRRALAYATDRARIAGLDAPDFYMTATGPYAPSSPWFAESGYPGYDPAEARRLIEEYEAETGTDVAIALTGAGDRNIVSMNGLQEMWAAAGIDVEVSLTDQASLIVDGLAGDFDAGFWAQHAGPDPDMEWHWWHGANAAPLGEIALNFTRNDDETLNAALDEGRSNPDEEARREAYAVVQERFAENLPIIWLYHNVAAIIADNSVHDITNGPLPDGGASMPLGGWFAGIHRFNQIWLDQ